MKAKDLTGQRFGRLVVLKALDKRSASGARFWLCRCDCGKTKETVTNSLISGDTRSCGCIKAPDLTGQRFGRLVALGEAEGTRQRSKLWRWRCDCGRIVELSRSQVLSGNSSSCGCLASDHGKRQIQAMQQQLTYTEGTLIEEISSHTPRKNTSSGVRGVSWCCSRKKWRASIMLRRKGYFLGYYDTVKEAAKARAKAEAEMYAPLIEKHSKEKKL